MRHEPGRDWSIVEEELLVRSHERYRDRVDMEAK